MENDVAINMSYCRFENTLAALRECSQTLEDKGPDPLAQLSRDEARKLFELCADLAEAYCEDP